jgi:hypothetical protein
MAENEYARVAQIINARELVINIGSNNDVEEGMKFAILAESPMLVKDPETGEILDEIDREKIRVMATEVRPKITICKTYKSRRTSGGPGYTMSAAGILSGFMDAPKEAFETLRARDSSLPAPLSPEDSFVKINDRVKIVEE